ncbi:MAG: leucyl aminopeptidase [Acidobacteriota bacterium]|nr:leucyl aminopeptidase [Acidobacteriota bacterium]MDQ7086387.1 leucyl aminopeptidase [Acidobacteriota bacterium]
MTKVQVSPREWFDLQTDVDLLFLFEGQAARKLLSGKAGRQLEESLARRGFSAGSGKTAAVEIDIASGRRLLIVAGLGAKDELDTRRLHRAAAAAVRAARACKARSVGVGLPGPGGRLRDVGERCRALFEGLLLGSYTFDRYRSKPDNAPPARRVIVAAGRHAAAAKKTLAAAVALGEGVALARDLVNEPAGTLDPVTYAGRIRQHFRSKKVQVRVFGRAQIEKLSMGALLQVAVGSEVPPRVVHLVWRPARPRKKVALVGKGVTFDSGGYNIKTTGHIETMKCDMAGSAAVIGAIHAASRLNLPVEVHGVVGLVENLVSGKAYKPGDVLRTRSGKTVEINNTDAEGRLVLADILDYAGTTIKPDLMIDLATLTGACVVALGEHCSAVFGRDEDLRKQLLAAAQRAGELMWPLPMIGDYFEQLRSPIADCRNTGSRWGGSITAALFLEQFVGQTPWLHLDIAGPAFLEKQDPFWGEGGTGAGVPTLLALLSGLSL